MNGASTFPLSAKLLELPELRICFFCWHDLQLRLPFSCCHYVSPRISFHTERHNLFLEASVLQKHWPKEGSIYDWFKHVARGIALIVANRTLGKVRRTEWEAAATFSLYEPLKWKATFLNKITALGSCPTPDFFNVYEVSLRQSCLASVRQEERDRELSTRQRKQHFKLGFPPSKL